MINMCMMCWKFVGKWNEMKADCTGDDADLFASGEAPKAPGGMDDFAAFGM